MSEPQNATVSHASQQEWMKRGWNRLVLQPKGKAPTELYEIRHHNQPLIDGAWGAMVPEGMCVLDVDVKDNQPGLASLEQLQIDLGCVPFAERSFTVDTPSGGLHIYMTIPPGFRTGAAVRGYPGLDIKGPGNNYVVGPGSVVEYAERDGTRITGTYSPRQPLSASGTVHAPDGLLDLIKPREVALGPDIVDHSDDNLDRFSSRVRTHIDQHGYHQRFVLAQIGGDLGLSAPATLQVMVNFGFNEADTASKVDHAYRYRQNRIGSKTARAIFEPVTPEEVAALPEVKPPPERTRGWFRRATDLEPAQPDWLIEGFLERDSVCMVVGDSQAYKSFITLDWALSIGAGRDWCHRAVEQAPVAVIMGEGHNDLARRVRAWAEHHEQQVPEVAFFSRSSTEMISNGSAQNIVDRWNESGEPPPALLVIDTLARNLGGNEDSAEQVSLMYANTIDPLRLAWPGLAVVIVHHVGHKDPGRGRGSRSLYQNSDTEYLVARDDEGGLRTTLSCNKMKSAEFPESVKLEATVVTFEHNGEQLNSLALDEHNPPLFEAQISEQEQTVALEVIAEGESKREWARRMNAIDGRSETSPTTQRKWGVTVALLFDAGLVCEKGSKKTPTVTPSGLAKLKENQLFT